MLAFTVLFLAATAPISFLASRIPRYGGGWVLAGAPGALFVYFALNIPASRERGFALTEVYPWVEALNLRVSLVLDGLSLLFALIITGIGVLVLGYSGYFMATSKRTTLLSCYLLLFIGAMLGLVLAGDVLTLVLFWGLALLLSFLLVGFWHDEAGARRSAQQSALVTGGGGVLLLVGLLLLSSAAQQEGVATADSYMLRAILAAGERITANPLYLPALLLIFVGCGSISALFPFCFWLPNATLHAPTPASAYVHAVTMVYAGIYLLARLEAALGTTVVWCQALTVVGSLTMLLGAWEALFQHDAKRLLAYNTVSWFGALVVVLGSTWEGAALVLMVGIVAHALYQGALLLLMGIVQQETRTSSLHQPAGLHLAMPVTASLVIGAALSMGGVPIFLGYVARTLLLEVGVYAARDPQAMLSPVVGYGAVAAMLVSSTLSVVYAWKLVGKTFFSGLASGAKIDIGMVNRVEDPPPGMLVGAGVLTGFSLLLSAALLPSVQEFLTPAVEVVAGRAVGFELLLWNNFRPTFFLGLIPPAGGLVLVWFERSVVASVQRPGWLNPDTLYDMLDRSGKRAAVRFTYLLQGGRLRTYVAMMMVMALGVVGPVLVSHIYQDYHRAGGVALPPLATLLDEVFTHSHVVLAAVLIPLGIIAMLRTTSRLKALIFVVVVGVAVSLFFAFSGAPELALTQVLIEVLLVVFLLPVFAVLPARFKVHSAWPARLRDMLFALAVGGMMAALFLVVATSQRFESVATAYLAESHALDLGTNVVHLILVDFRGLDTFGAVVGLLLALLSAYGLLRLRRSGPHP